MFEYQAPAQLLEGRTILVTGAGSGIGKAAALTYARHGATVILLGRQTHLLEQVYDEICAHQPRRPVIVTLDLETLTPAQCDQLKEQISGEFGRLDGLLHNAGQLGRLGPLGRYDPAVWQQVMQVNVTATFLLSRALLPLLRAAEMGSVVFTTSSVGQRGRAHWGAYAVSKFAVEGLMQVMADEEDGASSVRCNAINPGATRTAMRASAYPAENRDALASPERLMPLYLYLMGRDSQHENGQVLSAQ